jgi:CPA1 family monovalent cation:H+ antiporter
VFDLIAALLVVTAGFAWANHLWLRLPANIGLLVMGLCSSLLLIGIEFLFPGNHVYDALARTLRRIDFYEAVMQGMLAFLLFAGALHVDIARLRSRAPVVILLATLGVFLSTLLIGVGMWLVAMMLGLQLPLTWALVFGALIAPTDPVAVLTTLRSVKVPQSLEMDMTGEALFNDGVAVVLFSLMLAIAVGASGEVGPARALSLLFIEAVGGGLIGFATGYLAYLALHAIDDYSTEVMITIALVAGTYALANTLHTSGPIAVVVAGVLTGNRSAEHAMSDITQRYVFGFWTLTDDILNAILFLLIGLEVLVLEFDPGLLVIALISIPLALLARFLSVGGPILLLARWQNFVPGTVAVLTWGAVRGGISIALALSLPSGPARSLILAATYAVVLFTVIVQGLSLGKVIRATCALPPRSSAE